MSETPVDTGPGFGRRASRGAAVTLGAQGIRILVQLLSVVLLSRLLSPHDYGLVAMVVTIVGVGEIFRDFGLSSAAVQARTLSRGQRSNLFWINTGIGLLLALIVFLCADLIAAIYGVAELAPIARALAVTFLLNGLATQFRADLQRHLRFTALAVADISGPVAALVVALITAALGWGYWALVAQQLTSGIVLTVVLVVAARWLPGLPRRDEPMRGLVSFGLNLVGSQLIGYVGNNIDSFVIGRRFGASSLGLYNRSFQLLMTPLNQVRSPLTTVALPVLARLGDDFRRAGDYVVRAQLAMGYTLVAGLSIAASAAEPITALLLGPQWDGVAPIFRLLAIAGAFQTLAFVGYWVYTSRGLTRQLLQYSLVSVAIKIPCILVGAQWGVLGVAAGYAIAPAISWPISLLWLSRCTVLPTARLYAGAGRVLGIATVAGGLSYLATTAAAPLGNLLGVLIAIVVTALTYAIAWLLIPIVRRDIAGIVELLRLVVSRRSAPDAPTDETS